MSSRRSAANALAQCVCQIHDRNGERSRAPAWSRSHAVAPTASRRSASSTFTGKPSEVFGRARGVQGFGRPLGGAGRAPRRSEEHTSELQSRFDLVCRLLLEKKIASE